MTSPQRDQMLHRMKSCFSLLGVALLLMMACTVAEGPEDFPKQRHMTPTSVPTPSPTTVPTPSPSTVPTPSPTETSNPYLPVQSEEVNIYMEAEMVGELVLENGCLRAKGGGDGNALLIWPYGSEMTTNGQGVRVRKKGSDLDVTLSVGHRVRFGGGYRSINLVRGYTVEPIPSSCLGGPYWLVGEISTTLE